MKKESLLFLVSWVALFAAIITVYRLFLIPTDPKNAVLWGFSRGRLILIAIPIFISVLLLGFNLIIHIAQKPQQKIIQAFDDLLAQSLATKSFLLSCGIVLTLGLIVHLTPQNIFGDSTDQIIRLIPLIDLAMVFAWITFIAWFTWSGRRVNWKAFRDSRDLLRYTAFTGSILLLIFIFVLITHIGITPDRSGWYPPGTPILFSQIVLALSILGAWAIIMTLAFRRLGSSNVIRYSQKHFDLLVCCFLWIAAFALWWTEPLKKPSYFSPTPVAPNYQNYPYSDGAEYDGYAQELIMGRGNQMGLIRRPVYAYFLAGLHWIVGQDYSKLITLQIGLFASIAALMYILVKQLSNRGAGLIAAILVILREHNSIVLTNVIEVSHSKLLLSEVPAMGLMLLLCVLLIRWLANPDHKTILAVLAGSVLGLLAMIRSQSILLGPVILLVATWFLRSNWKKVFGGLTLFAVGLSVTITPWMIRSQQISGRFVIEDTDKYIDLFASGYTFTPYESISTLPGETRAEHYDRMVRQITDFIKEYPGEVLGFYSAHFFHNEIEKIIYLPLDLSFQDLRSYTEAMGFWKAPLRSLTLGSMILLILNLCLISFGIASSFKKIKWLAIIPIIICTAYSLSVVPARLSSGRFILPADWITLVFLAIGILECGAILWALFTSRGKPQLFSQDDQEKPNWVSQPDNRRWFIPAISFLVLGIGFALAPELIPEKYPAITTEDIILRYFPAGASLDNGISYSREEIEEFTVNEPDAVVMLGSNLYPRFYKAGEYWGDDNLFNLEARKYNRLQFDLIGSQPGSILLPMKSPPRSFPMGVDTLVIGCRYNFGMMAIIVKTVGNAFLLSSEPWHGLACPPQDNQP